MRKVQSEGTVKITYMHAADKDEDRGQNPGTP